MNKAVPYYRDNSGKRPQLTEHQRWLRTQRWDERKLLSGHASSGHASMPKTFTLRGGVKSEQKVAAVPVMEAQKA